MKSLLYPASRVGHRLLCVLLLVCPAALAQSASDLSAPVNQPEIASKIERLTKSLEQTQVELAQSRTEIQQLRVALQEMLTRMDAMSPTAGLTRKPGHRPNSSPKNFAADRPWSPRMIGTS